MELYLIRHAEIAAGSDPHERVALPVSGRLSETGERQAAALARALREVAFDAVYASPLGRAAQTAQAFTAPEKIVLLPWLIEWQPASVLTPDAGASGPSDTELMARADGLPPERAWKTPAGEGTFEMAHRLVPPLLDLLAHHGAHAEHGGYRLDPAAESTRLALVAHGGCLGMILAFLLGVPLRPHGPVQFEHTGTAIIRFTRRRDVWYPGLLVR